mgnify:CR=1 FL=1
MEVNFTTPLDLDTSGDISKYDNAMTEGKFWAILFATCIALKFLELIGVPLWTDNERIELEQGQLITLLDWAKGKEWQAHQIKIWEMNNQDLLAKESILKKLSQPIDKREPELL